MHCVSSINILVRSSEKMWSKTTIKYLMIPSMSTRILTAHSASWSNPQFHGITNKSSNYICPRNFPSKPKQTRKSFKAQVSHIQRAAPNHIPRLYTKLLTLLTRCIVSEYHKLAQPKLEKTGSDWQGHRLTFLSSLLFFSAIFFSHCTISFKYFACSFFLMLHSCS